MHCTSQSKNYRNFAESLMGDASQERGGASMSHDEFASSSPIVDCCLLRRVVMSSMSSLHREERWEKLVDIGIRFTAYSGLVQV